MASCTRCNRELQENHLLADVWVCHEDGLEDPTEGEANANLFAAAPDLYKACKAAVICMEEHPELHNIVMEMLKKALAKAEGK